MMLPKSRISNTWETKSQAMTKMMMPVNTFNDRLSFMSR